MLPLSNRTLTSLSFLELANTFSLPVVFGVPITHLFFAQLFGVNFNWTVSLVLMLAVVLIYTTDHLIDGYKWKDNSHTLRHFIHYKYAKAMKLVIFVSAAALIYFGLQFNSDIKKFGYVIAFITALYLILNAKGVKAFRSTLVLKELFIALVVSACFVLLPLFQGGLEIELYQVMLFIGFGMLNFGNLMMFTYFDFETDKLAGFKELNGEVKSAGIKRISIVILCISLLFNSTLMFIYSFNALAVLIVILMHISLLTIYWKEKYFMVKERFRLAGDMIYVLPAIYLLVA